MASLMRKFVGIDAYKYTGKEETLLWASSEKDLSAAAKAEKEGGASFFASSRVKGSARGARPSGGFVCFFPTYFVCGECQICKEA